MTIDSTLQQMRTAFSEAKAMKVTVQTTMVSFAPMKPMVQPNVLEAIMNRRFEGQMARMEKLLGKLAKLLDKIGDDLGRSRWMPPMDDPFGDPSDWQTTLPWGSGADPDEVISGSGRIWGDPHFVGADGGKYDVQGEAGKIYNLLSDKNFQMNGRFDAWGSGGATVVGEVGITANGDKIRVKGDGSVTVNGRAVADGQRVALADGGFVERDGKSIKVQSGEWSVDFQAKESRNGAYLNMDVSTDNAVADGVKPHGLLGQTFDGDGVARNGDKGRGAQGGGAIEDLSMSQTERGDLTAVKSYEVSSLNSTNSSSFDRYTPYEELSFEDVFGDLFGGSDLGLLNGWGFGSSSEAMEAAEDFFGGFRGGWGFNSSDDALRAVHQAYGSLAISIASTASNIGWTGLDWNSQR